VGVDAGEDTGMGVEAGVTTAAAGVGVGVGVRVAFLWADHEESAV